MSLSQRDLDTRRDMARAFFKVIPHSVVLGLEVLSVEPGLVIARLPYRPEIVGNPYSGQIHGGAAMNELGELIAETRRSRNYQPLVDVVPYARLLGMDFSDEADGRLSALGPAGAALRPLQRCAARAAGDQRGGQCLAGNARAGHCHGAHPFSTGREPRY
jgi:hypothetical protein